MNQEQAKRLIELAEQIGWKHFRHELEKNKDHIKYFSNSGIYQFIDFDNKWSESRSLDFCNPPNEYRPVPARKIDGEKAMKSGAYGVEFDFDGRKGVLIGFFSNSEMPFLFVTTAGKLSRSARCEPLPGFDVPECWLEDV
jgi:hypothetical protein